MNEKCRYGRDSEVKYNSPFHIKMQKYECPNDAYTEGFCIFHKEKYWKQNKESEEKVRKAFMEVIERAKHGEDILCIGYHLPDIRVWERKLGETLEIKGFVNFEKTRFQSVYLHGVTFHKIAVFEGAIFEKDAKFSSVTFNEEADFQKVEFQGQATFRNNMFLKEAKFEGATFHKQAFFGGAGFKSRTTFEGAIFHEKANFNGAIFLQMIDFSFAKFKGLASFRHTFFISEEEVEEKSEKSIEFRGVKFDSPEEISFENCNLNYLSFIHTDITRVKFRNITWPRPTNWKPKRKLKQILSHLGKYGKRLSSFGEMDVYLLLDDKFLERKKKGKLLKIDGDLTISNILTSYRMLRENYEYNVDYENAGRFFVGEMEARRRNSTFFLERIILESYKHLAIYGQSYARPLLALLLLIVFFQFLVGLGTNLLALFQGMPINIISGIKESFIATLSPDNLLNSLAISFQLQEETKGVYIIQRIVSILFLVLFGLALRRRFERRFRH